MLVFNHYTCYKSLHRQADQTTKITVDRNHSSLETVSYTKGNGYVALQMIAVIMAYQ